MDKVKLEELIHAGEYLVDLDFENQKDKIDAKFEKNGLLLSGQHLRAIGREEAKRNHKKKILRLKLENQTSGTQDKQTESQIYTYKDPRLYFYPGDSRAEYKGLVHVFNGKVKVLLTILSDNKNTPFSLSEIIRLCNSKLAENKHFKTSKDTRDTILYLKKRLKVNKGEFFPVQKRDTGIIWIEK